MVGRPIDIASKRDKLWPSNFDGNANIDASHNTFFAFFVVPFKKNLSWSFSSLISFWTWLVKYGSTDVSPHHSHTQSGYLSLTIAKALISNSGLFCSAIRAILIIFLDVKMGRRSFSWKGATLGMHKIFVVGCKCCAICIYSGIKTWTISESLTAFL